MAKFSGENNRIWLQATRAMESFFNKLDLPALPRSADPNTVMPVIESFYGREELRALEEHLVHNKTDLSPLQRKGITLLADSPHTGRTQLAAAFCSGYRTSFRSILWFNAKTDEEFHKSCYENACGLKLPLEDLKNADFQQN
ncbi:hypothetical protein NA56DRAFT_712405 [Hyaloscypha hepaticicola]|uniref:Uncharacterized protein n=1 Tax=Hyaloscypha hepaticicola TaxID=2082293 RepID=A0A2J6PGE8_9HELO|nr:hypothetical protein NA56DRAFT_712405 [Hyaloscypha hepaticicola]